MVQTWVWDLDLQPARKLVLLWLAGRATESGVAFPGEREIRERTGLGERMVRYHPRGPPPNATASRSRSDHWSFVSSGESRASATRAMCMSWPYRGSRTPTSAAIVKSCGM